MHGALTQRQLADSDGTPRLLTGLPPAWGEGDFSGMEIRLSELKWLAQLQADPEANPGLPDIQ